MYPCRGGFRGRVGVRDYSAASVAGAVSGTRRRLKAASAIDEGIEIGGARGRSRVLGLAAGVALGVVLAEGSGRRTVGPGAPGSDLGDRVLRIVPGVAGARIDRLHGDRRQCRGASAERFREGSVARGNTCACGSTGANRGMAVLEQRSVVAGTIHEWYLAGCRVRRGCSRKRDRGADWRGGGTTAELATGLGPLHWRIRDRLSSARKPFVEADDDAASVIAGRASNDTQPPLNLKTTVPSTVKDPANGPVALVTGSGTPRIGNVVVRTLAARGYRVVVHANTSLDEGRRPVAELAADGRQALAVTADLRDDAAVEHMVRTVHDHFGRIDALVNCAAIWQAKPLEEVTADDVRNNLEINTLGTFLCCQRVGLVMVGQPEGVAIVNLGDWATARPYLDYAAYFPSKGAIPALTRSFAAELASRNPRIRVNAILPGPVMMPDSLPPEERARAISGTLLRREGSPQNIADAVVFLLENDYITGALSAGRRRPQRLRHIVIDRLFLFALERLHVVLGRLVARVQSIGMSRCGESC